MTTKTRFRQAAITAASVTAMLVTLALAPAAQAGERNQAKVSFLEGKATNSPGGKDKAVPLTKGATVFEGDLIETAEGGKLELEMKDGSVVRVGPASKMELRAAIFGDDGKKTFSAKLVFGSLWSKVSGLVGGESKFEVETDNAVAGVRGTTFRIDAKKDKSMLVRVYAGSVAMAPSAALAKKAPKAAPGKRVQVAGPNAVTLKEWEKIVGKMMQLSINADGTPSGDPTAFTEKDDAGNEWAAWNTMMDEKK